MIVALDVLLSAYQGILLIYLARKQFILKPHSFLVEIGCVMAVTLYFAGIQYLGIPIPDNFVIIILFVYSHGRATRRMTTSTITPSPHRQAVP